MNNEKSNSIKEMIMEYTLKHVSDLQLDYDLKIFEEGVVNSLFAIELMTYLEKTFKIKIKMEDLDMDNFQSINVVAEFVNRKMDGDSNA